MTVMNIKVVAKRLCDALDFTPEQMGFIERRLTEIAVEENLSIEELDNLCWEDSNAMFDRIWCG